jgi:hypothetical protein
MKSLEEYVTESRVAQGLTARVIDPAVLALVAAILAPGRDSGALGQGAATILTTIATVATTGRDHGHGTT